MSITSDLGPRLAAIRLVPIVGSPPPVVSVILDGEVACLMMRELAPDPVVPGATYEWNIRTAFRVHGGKIAEHWSTFRKVRPGPNPDPRPQ